MVEKTTAEPSDTRRAHREQERCDDAVAGSSEARLTTSRRWCQSDSECTEHGSQVSQYSQCVSVTDRQQQRRQGGSSGATTSEVLSTKTWKPWRRRGWARRRPPSSWASLRRMWNTRTRPCVWASLAVRDADLTSVLKRDRGVTRQSWTRITPDGALRFLTRRLTEVWTTSPCWALTSMRARLELELEPHTAERWKAWREGAARKGRSETEWNWAVRSLFVSVWCTRRGVWRELVVAMFLRSGGLLCWSRVQGAAPCRGARCGDDCDMSGGSAAAAARRARQVLDLFLNQFLPILPALFYLRINSKVATYTGLVHRLDTEATISINVEHDMDDACVRAWDGGLPRFEVPPPSHKLQHQINRR